MYSQILKWFEFPGESPHWLSCVSLAHSGSLISALVVINSTCSIVASPPAVLDRWVVASIKCHLTKWMFLDRQHSKVRLRICYSRFPMLTYFNIFNIIDKIIQHFLNFIFSNIISIYKILQKLNTVNINLNIFEIRILVWKIVLW